VAAERNVSVGQALATPSHDSAESQTPAETRHTAVLLASAGHVLELPLQTSAGSQAPAEARHWAVLLTSAGHVEVPSQVSARSHAPAEARHVAPRLPAVCAQVPEPLQTSTVQGFPSSHVAALQHTFPVQNAAVPSELAHAAAAVHDCPSALA
jgi:hypothetical protein